MKLPFIPDKKAERGFTAFKYNALDENGKKFAGTEMAASLGAAASGTDPARSPASGPQGQDQHPQL